MITRVVIVEDQVMFLQLLSGMLRSQPGIQLLATCLSVAEAKLAFKSLAGVDLVILDLDLSDGSGLDVLRHAVEKHPDLSCIILSGHASEFVSPPDLKERICAVVDKTETYEYLRVAIEEVVFSQDQSQTTSPSPVQVLTQRELEIFHLIGKGFTSKEIAGQLQISVHTVETHRKSITRKLQTSGSSLVRLAGAHNQTALQLVD
jgi:DNA-binding NarL/FixJ family response regulator